MAAARVHVLRPVIFVCFFVFVICEDSFSPAVNIPLFSSSQNITEATRFFIFDVNPGEGFNLRRDVYGRVANLVKHLIDRGEDWVLVLPPWRHLYHWKSRYLSQEATPWRSFFDLASMNLYLPIMEFEEFWSNYAGDSGIGHILYLQRHPDGFKNGWKELVEIQKCHDDVRHGYHQDNVGKYRGYFWDKENVFATKFDCVSVQGHASVLADLIKKVEARSVFVERFESVLHMNYGSVEFFKPRRSLVFAKHLRNVGDKYRSKFLNSNDEKDKTQYNDEDWRNQTPEEGSALGGPYIGIHMRRADFAYAHKETIPSIKELGEEIKKVIEKYKVKKVYVSTDGTDEEVKELQSYFKAKVFRFPRPNDVIEKYKDGGVAIIDQWIVAHARYFIGTCESTFSFRIHEERDILGFHPDTTYNCICGKQSPEDRCHPPTRWRVKF